MGDAELKFSVEVFWWVVRLVEYDNPKNNKGKKENVKVNESVVF